MIYGGVDGCKYGWILIKSVQNKLVFGGLYRDIEDLVNDNEDLDRILIDIPIGLSSKKVRRTIDSYLKLELKERHSTVFNAPCRESLVAKNHKEASLINKEIEGKGISIQTFFISKKIRELDLLLIRKESLRDKIFESHPELSFKYLNSGTIVLSKKSSKEGLEERINILQKFDSDVLDLYNEVLSATKRMSVSRDDVVDAICLCLVNQLSGKNALSFLQDKFFKDGIGIPIRVGYFHKMYSNV